MSVEDKIAKTVGKPPQVRQLSQSERIDDLIMRELGIEEEQLDRKTKLSDFNADSLDLTELSIMLEEEFELPEYELEEDVDRFKTIGDVHKFVERAIKKRGQKGTEK
jgi:acyl carrier protein